MWSMTSVTTPPTRPGREWIEVLERIFRGERSHVELNRADFAANSVDTINLMSASAPRPGRG